MKITRLNPKSNEGWCNTYVLGEENDDCIIVDPGYNGNHFLENYVSKHHKKILGILLTHGHFDHINGLTNFEGIESIPVFMSADEVDFLSDPYLNLSYRHDIPNIELKNINVYPLEDEDEIKLGHYILKAVATPFHTGGSMCFIDDEDGNVLSGDTLFHLCVGRSDLPTSCPRKQDESLRHLLDNVKPHYKLHPGHGGGSSIQDELRFNPFLSNL